MKLLLLFLLTCFFNITVYSQNCNYYLDDDKKGNGDFFTQELTTNKLIELTSNTNETIVVLQNSNLYASNSLTPQLADIGTLIQNYNFSSDIKSEGNLDSFVFDTNAKEITQYRILKDCDTGKLQEYYTLIVLN